MPDLVTYGDNNITFPFRITLNGLPVSVTLGAGDVVLYKDNVYEKDITARISQATDGSGNHVYYYWSPQFALDLQASDSIVISIEDVSGGGAFDANMLVLYTGGSVSARYSG